jgi:hypothetical protein
MPAFKDLVQVRAKPIMIAAPVQDAKADFAFWAVTLRPTAPTILFATANSVFLAAQLTTTVLTELFAEAISAKLVAEIIATVSLAPSVLTASVILVVLKLLTVLFPDNSATTVIATSSDARTTPIAYKDSFATPLSAFAFWDAVLIPTVPLLLEPNVSTAFAK